MSDNISYQQQQRPFLLPQELMDMEPGTGRLWLPGMGTRNIPFFAPNYWRIRSASSWVASRATKPLPTVRISYGFPTRADRQARSR